ncbi:MAG: nucleotide exchange factor GrpE [Candidatus Sungbacteria bacterium RIFCSPLOWO2_02_FULL_54_10]|uniref:Protein GrpE n=2 Tax=Candidatus Sungiibacteriota TaxID=1817917 RepID=A0A1G2L4V3_9BACT|nr:MAG: nucleotide exchange factor GrpE [Candidatus Sungbacteria bacterium RIFCSPHIGHO2_01_FULL_54_26]OHA03636.1 MAG: nucleotide exchange factor GrpE [Candidatus Sungbacteria bacterium RIFCSPHIGHO2_02_FULL_53_17]OHA06698.1 MAG: nucleotide exchange factor GrpE [Candidatus Sungbacteria bacterium RIFCSPLOWO2_01_FULL_54_21]OHA11999.1 MAG: nucleotide exchange factor GrpE [Candidatus Sungbacteria bacterium RIFCSPLOWO2_02_FULL_54_10]
MMHNSSDEDIEIAPEPDTDARPRDAEEKIQKQKSEIDRLEKERREYLEGWQRAKADFINYKKNEHKRVEELLRFAAGSLVTELLVVLDSFDLALGGADDRGMQLIRAQLEDILRRHGLEPVSAAPGDAFSPERHEAIGEEESAMPEGTIASVLQKGYMLSGRLIRPARVKISKGKSDG